MVSPSHSAHVVYPRRLCHPPSLQKKFLGPGVVVLDRGKMQVGRRGYVSLGGKGLNAYHRLVSESLDLLDGTGSSLLEGNTVHLLNTVPSVLAIPKYHLLHYRKFAFVMVGKHTLLWRWMVYSRATTSAMAERPCLPVFLVVDDISTK